MNKKRAKALAAEAWDILPASTPVKGRFGKVRRLYRRLKKSYSHHLSRKDITKGL